MVAKPKLIFHMAFLLSVLGANFVLSAQSQAPEKEDGHRFAPLNIETSSKKSGDQLPVNDEASKGQKLSAPVVVAPANIPNVQSIIASAASTNTFPNANKLNEFKGIPSAFISLGNRQPTYGIVVEKNIHRLTVFKLQDDGNYAVMKSYKAITGKEIGDKKYSGDNRTPEGIYFVVGEKNKQELSKRWGKSANKYGPRAFVLDYPNIFDKRLHKTGFGIWLHGVDKDTRILRPFDTEGCVALTNKDVLDVSNYITPWETPVVIVDKMQSTTTLDIQDERGKVLDMLETWRKAWESSDISKYTGFYSDHFYSLGKTKAQWESFKQRLAKLRDKTIQVQISEPKILAFKNQLLVEFLQKYHSKGKLDYGRKFLYLRQEGDDFKIIAEKWYPIKDRNDVELAVNQNSHFENQRQAKN